jgi:predicted transposase/invertase (TIGR01784 family)
MSKSLHDAFFKKVFSYRTVYLDFFNQLTPPWLRVLLDVETIVPIEGTFLTKELKQFFSDKLFSAKVKSGHEITLSCLLEHKSYVPDNIYEQLHRYILEKRVQDRRNKEQKTLVVPFVIYHGNERWVKKPPHTFYPALPKALRRFVVASDYILVDVGRFSKKKIMELRQGYLVNSLLLLKYSHRPDLLEGNLRDIFVYGDYYSSSEEGREFIFSLLTYLFELGKFEPEKQEEIVKKIKEPLKNSVMTIFEIKAKKAKKEGLQEGMEKGKIIKATDVTIRLIEHGPELSDDVIANISGLPEPKVKEIRQKLAEGKKGEIAPAVDLLFKNGKH